MELEIETSLPTKPHQKLLLDYCKIANGIQHVVVVNGRQSLKSSSMLLCGLDHCFEQPHAKVGIALPVFAQCRELYHRYKKMLTGMVDAGLCRMVGQPTFRIEFWNGSSIEFISAETESARGRTYTMLCIDEAAFVKDDIWYNVLEATVAVELSKADDNGIVGNRGKVLILSTPKTASGWYYNMAKEAEDCEDGSMVLLRMTSEEGGVISKQILDKIRQRVPESTYKMEYEGVFMQSGEGMFRFKPCVQDIDSKDGWIAGLDLGSKDDYTVLTIQDRNGSVILVERWRHMEWSNILKAVVTLLNQYGKPTVYVETNGIGQMPYETLRKMYPKTKGWTTTSNSKNDAIQQLILDFNTNNITVPNIEWALAELDNFTAIWKNGKIKYEGSNGYHDDSVMSLAICNYNRGRVKDVRAMKTSRPQHRL